MYGLGAGGEGSPRLPSAHSGPDGDDRVVSEGPRLLVSVCTVCLRIIAISARRQYRSTRSGLSGTGGGRGWVTPGRVSSGEARQLAGSARRPRAGRCDEERERGEERRGGDNVRSPSGSYQAAERDSLHVIETELCNFGMSHVVNYY